jgi:tRNA(Ser,Leu) C12 N-acetylase TAN1
MIVFDVRLKKTGRLPLVTCLNILRNMIGGVLRFLVVFNAQVNSNDPMLGAFSRLDIGVK